MVPREPIEKAQTEDLYGHFGPVPTYKETLPNGVKHTIIEIQGDEGFNDNAGPFVVPANHYFMMGDNRDNSTDSRVPPDQGGVGYVPFENIEGRAEVIFFSVGDGARGLRILALAVDVALEPHVPDGQMTGEPHRSQTGDLAALAGAHRPFFRRRGAARARR